MTVRRVNTYQLLRDHSRDSGDYVTAPAGTVVHQFTGATYGCIAWPGVACSLEPNVYPFFEVQVVDLEYVGLTTAPIVPLSPSAAPGVVPVPRNTRQDGDDTETETAS